MGKYEVILKNSKLKGYALSGWLILLLSMVGQLYFSLSGKFRGDLYWVTGMIVATGALFLLARSRNQNNFKDRDYVIGFGYAISTLIWLKWQLYVIAVFVFLIYVLYHLATRRFQVLFSTNTISYSAFPRRTIQWNELNNVIMKDGILTIDFKDNKLLQNEMEGDDKINEKEFNEFCSKQLSTVQ
jgi:hypothetical protein